jgi:catechol 2,3-dioxygenase-like lactoylglutathione lyase family enzyme
MIALHHVQVCCPRGGEDGARRFYAGALGMAEVGRPRALRARGGAWFRAYDARGAVAVEVHVGVEDAFIPAARAHPAFLVDDLRRVADSMRDCGFEVDDRERESFDGYLRFHTRDAAGNRVEVLQPVPPVS